MDTHVTYCYKIVTMSLKSLLLGLDFENLLDLPFLLFAGALHSYLGAMDNRVSDEVSTAQSHLVCCTVCMSYAKVKFH